MTSNTSTVERPTLLSQANDGTPSTTENVTRRDIYTIQCQPRNEELQHAVQDSFGAIYPLQEELKALMDDWQSRWQSWCDDNTKQVRTFDDELQYYSKKPYGSDQLDDAYACHFKSEWLGTYLKKLKALQRAAEDQREQERQKEKAALEKRFEGLTPEEADLLRQEIQSAEDEVRENEPPLSPNTVSKVKSSKDRRVSFSELHESLINTFYGPIKRATVTQNIEDVNSTLFPLQGHELVHYTLQTHDNGQADPLSLLRAEFAKSLAVVAANETKLTEYGNERDELITQERVADAEAKTRMMIDNMTDTLHIVFSRFKQSRIAEVDVQEFGAHVAATAEATKSHLDEARKDAEETRERGSQDLANLREMIKRHQETSRQQRLMFESRREDSNTKLKTNTTEQQQAWGIIMAQLAKLKELCLERESLVSDRMIATEKEQERTQTNREVEAMSKAREDDLVAVVENATRALEYVSSGDKLSETVQENVRNKQFPAKLLGYQVEEGLRFADIYKRYSLFAGRALFLRQQRLENVRRLVRATEFQVQSATDTFDSDLALYRSQLMTLQQSEDNLKGESAALSDQMAKEAKLWDEVETFLDEKNIAVEQPPSLAVQELQRDMLKNHVEAIDVLTNTEQKLLDKEKAYVRKMHNACVAAKEVLQERKNRLPSSASPSPLSPANRAANNNTSEVTSPSKADAAPAASPLHYQ